MENNDGRAPTKKEMYDSLSDILSCAMYKEANTSMLKNERLLCLEKTSEYPIVLLDFIGSSKENVQKRRIASELLKSYLEAIWDKVTYNEAISDKGYGKILILRLIEILNTGNAEMREVTACNVSLLLRLGFWNEVSPLLDYMIHSQDPSQIENWILVMNKSMDKRFLQTEICDDLQPHWFELLIDTLKMTNISMEARTHCVQPLFVLMKLYNPSSPHYAPEYLAKIVESFQLVLSELDGTNSDYTLKRGIIKGLNGITKEFEQYASLLVPPLLPTVWNLFEAYSQKCKCIIGKKDRVEGEAENFFDLVKSILEFIDMMIGSPYGNSVLDDLESLLYNSYIFMACNGNMERHLYVKAAQSCIHWAVRDICSRILIKILKQLEAHHPCGKTNYLSITNRVYQRIFEEFVVIQTPSNRNRDCVIESVAYGLGLIRNHCNFEELNCPILLNTYLEKYTDLLTHSSPMLQGRIIWLGGLYCKALTVRKMEDHLKHIESILSCQSDNIFLIVPAVEALRRYLKSHNKLSEDKQNILIQLGQKFLDGLVSASTKLYRLELMSSLNALGYLIMHQNHLVQPNLDQLNHLLITVLTKSSAHDKLRTQISFLCTLMAKAKAFRCWLTDAFLGFLYKWLKHMEPPHLVHDLDMALEVLNTICIHSPDMSEDFVMQSFKTGVTRLLENDDHDRDVDFHAGTLLITLVVKMRTEFQNMARTPECHSTLTAFSRMVEKLTSPASNFPDEILGLLVVNTICSLPSKMEPMKKVILWNVIANSGNSGKIRTCFEIFVYLAMVDTRWTLKWASKMDAPTKKGSALKFMLKQWRPEMFRKLTAIERKIITQALISILVQCLDLRVDCKPLESVTIELTDSSKSMNGVQYLFYLLIHLFLIEVDLNETGPPEDNDEDSDEVLVDVDKKKQEDEAVLYESHPFNIEPISQVVYLLNDGFEPYFSVLERFVTKKQVSVLHRLGCCVPEHLQDLDSLDNID